jgi:hypothetical protein
MTKTSLVHDMCVEEYHIKRVKRQFGPYQASHVPVAQIIDPSVHQ